MDEQIVRISAIRKQIVEHNKEKYQQNSKNKLYGELSKRLQTTMIGALAAFEERFGYLWGHGKPDAELTQDEVAVRDVWLQARKAVLDNGNLQLKKTGETLEGYTVSWEATAAPTTTAFGQGA